MDSKHSLFSSWPILWTVLSPLKSLANLETFNEKIWVKNMKSYKSFNKIFWNNIHFAFLWIMFSKRIKSKFTLTRKSNDSWLKNSNSNFLVKIPIPTNYGQSPLPQILSIRSQIKIETSNFGYLLIFDFCKLCKVCARWNQLDILHSIRISLHLNFWWNNWSKKNQNSCKV